MALPASEAVPSPPRSAPHFSTPPPRDLRPTQGRNTPSRRHAPAGTHEREGYQGQSFPHGAGGPRLHQPVQTWGGSWVTDGTSGPQSTALSQTSFEFGLNGFIFIFKIFSLQAVSTSFIVPISLVSLLTSLILLSEATPMLFPFTVAEWLPCPVLKPHSHGWVLGTPWELGHTGGQLLIRIVSHR